MSEAAAQVGQYWGLLSAIVGGVIGALAGGIPAWLLAKRQSDETLRRDREQRTEKEKALAFSVCVKLIVIINSTISLRNHVQQCLSLRTLDVHRHMEPWQVLVPMIGHTFEGSLRFDADELAVFEAAKERDFMMDTMLLAARHASSLASFQEYCERRESVQTIVPPPERFEGQVGSANLTEEQVLQLMPYTIPLNNIVTGLASGLEEDLTLARKVALGFGPIMRRHFNDTSFAGLTFPSDEELARMITVPNATEQQN